MKSVKLHVLNTVKRPMFWLGAVSFIFFLVLAGFFPYMQDDWHWGTRDWSAIVEPNGRYFGNLLVMLLTRIPFLKIAVVGGSCWLICYFAYRYACTARIFVYLLAVFCFFVMEKEMMAQGIVWTAGFSNYVPPVLIGLFYVLLVQGVLNAQPPQYAKGLSAITFLMGVAGGLFIENLTIFHVLLGAFVLAYTKVKFKKVYAVHLAFFAGAVLGALIMFSNPVYLAIFTTGDPNHYRTVGGENVAGLFVRMFVNFRIGCIEMFSKNAVLCMLISIMFSVYAFWHKAKKFIWICIFNMFVSLGLLATSFGFDIIHLSMKVQLLFLACAAVWLGTSVLLSVVLVKGTANKIRVLFPLGCAVVSAAPLLPVSPIGPRCFVCVYVLMMMSICALAAALFKDLSFKSKPAKVFLVTLCAAVLLTGGIRTYVYARVHHYDALRLDFAETQSENGADVLYICALPFADYLHYPDPYYFDATDDKNTGISADHYVRVFEKFYGLDTSAEMEVVSPEALDEMITTYETTGKLLQDIQ